VLAFPLSQTQEHLEQHHSSMEESLHMLNFPFAQAQAHLKQHHSTIKES
jgi:hypothetical protein